MLCPVDGATTVNSKQTSCPPRWPHQQSSTSDLVYPSPCQPTKPSRPTSADSHLSRFAPSLPARPAPAHFVISVFHVVWTDELAVAVCSFCGVDELERVLPQKYE